MKTLLTILILCFSAAFCLAQNTPDEIKPSDKYLNRTDLEQSLPRLKRAAESGIAEAQYNYGVYFLEIVQDPKMANEWFLKSAEQDFVNAQFKIAVSYANGRGIEVDYKKAFYWMTKCAEQNDAQAIFTLSQMYLKGIGTERDANKAIEWEKKLALLTDLKDSNSKDSTSYIGSARLDLAQCYMNGTDVKKDLVESYTWFLIFNENKENFGADNQENAIAQTETVEKQISESDKKKAINEAEKLLGHKLVNLSKLHSTVFRIPVK